MSQQRIKEIPHFCFQRPSSNFISTSFLLHGPVKTQAQQKTVFERYQGFCKIYHPHLRLQAARFGSHDIPEVSMTSNASYAVCTICGILICESPFRDISRPRDPRLWMSDAILMSGPHWSSNKKGPQSIRIPNGTVTLSCARTEWNPLRVHNAATNERVFVQYEDDATEGENHGTDADGRWYLMIHSVCNDIAERVARRSKTSRIQCIGDLWMTLDQRCTKALFDFGWGMGPFLPNTPIVRPEDRLGGYYLPAYAIPGCGGSEPYLDDSVEEWVGGNLNALCPG